MKYIITFCVLVSTVNMVKAQNLLANGDFDTDTSGWFAFSTISWVSDDGAPISGNGSMLNTGSLNNNSSFPAISDQFTVTPGYWYMSGVSFKVPAASPVPWAWYQIFWYDDMGVEIDRSDQIGAEFGVPNDVWEHLVGISQAPVGADMGELRIYLQTGDVGEPDIPFGMWDDVFVVAETIFASGF
ncbi:MAG: hypothetical protein ACSHWU_03770 [Marinicella sp.]